MKKKIHHNTAAMTGDFGLNVLNMNMFGLTAIDGKTPISGGLLELHLGKNGATMNIGMGGADVSMGTIAQSIAGLDAWRVNAKLWMSDQEEASRYTSGLRTLYSVGGEAEMALYNDILNGKANIEENAQGDYKAKTKVQGDGSKMIYLGKDALSDGSRFGMNILLAHEAYRNGIDDGLGGQQEETAQSVMGHINAAFALGQTYGMGSIGEAMAEEVDTYLKAMQTQDYSALEKLVAGYDSSGDYWKVKIDAEGVHWEDDKSDDLDLTAVGMGVIKSKDVEKRAGDIANAIMGTDVATNLALNKAILTGDVAALGRLGVTAKSMKDVVAANNGKGYESARKNYVEALNSVVLRDLSFIGLPGMPNQEVGYGPMQGNVSLTSRYGYRINTPEMVANGVIGQAFCFGLFHGGRDYASDKPTYISPEAGRLDLAQAWGGAFGFTTTWTDGTDRLLFDHNSANAIDVISRTVLANEGWTIAGGMGVGQTGTKGGVGYNRTTGTVTGPHLNLRYSLLVNNRFADPQVFYDTQNIVLNYPETDYSRYLSGYSKPAPDYFSSSVVNNVYSYSQTLGSQNFYNNYLSAHRRNNEGMFQLLSWLSFNRR